MGSREPFQLSHYGDFEVTAILFNREAAGLAAEQADEEVRVPSQFRHLTFLDELTGIEHKFDINSGVMISPMMNPERLVSDAYTEKFVNTEKKILKELNAAIDTINKREGVNKFFMKLRALKLAEFELHRLIINKPDGNNYASVYNNSAQVKRLIYELLLQEGVASEEKAPLTLEHIDQCERDILVYLKKSIDLALPSSVSLDSLNSHWLHPYIDEDPSLLVEKKEIYRVSIMQAKTLSSAYGQMAAILLQRASRVTKLLARKQELNQLLSPEQIAVLQNEKTNLESKASEFSLISGAFGNSFSEQNSLALNPWGKLCGNMFRDSLINAVLN